MAPALRGSQERQWGVTSQLNSISASMVTIRTVKVLGCFLLSELKLMREAMAPAMARGGCPGPLAPEARAPALLAPLEEPHGPQGHHGGRRAVWAARAPSGLHGRAPARGLRTPQSPGAHVRAWLSPSPRFPEAPRLAPRRSALRPPKRLHTQANLT